MMNQSSLDEAFEQPEMPSAQRHDRTQSEELKQQLFASGPVSEERRRGVGAALNSYELFSGESGCFEEERAQAFVTSEAENREEGTGPPAGESIREEREEDSEERADFVALPPPLP